MISTERLLSMSAIEGLRLLKMYRQRHPGMTNESLVGLIEKLSSDGRNLDLLAAFELEKFSTTIDTTNPRSLYQSCISSILVFREPSWLRLMTQGRMKFLKRLGLDEHDVFSAAGLLAKVPTVQVVTWWDSLVSHSRSVTDLQKMEQARCAERLSIEYEENLLVKMSISESPQWPGLDNNFAGYDVLSYRVGDSGLQHLMIEVKSTVASPLRFYVSKNEWNQADKYGDSYVFHVWDMSQNPPTLFQRTVEQVRPHIPSDNNKGAWKSAEIPINIGA